MLSIHNNFSAGTQNVTGAYIIIMPVNRSRITFCEIHTLLKEYRRTRKGMKDKRNLHGAVVNGLRNNIFVNPVPLPLLCEVSGAVHLAQPGLTAGRLAGRQAGWQAGWQTKYR